MMRHLVGNDIRLGEITTRRTEPRLELVEEPEIDIDRLIKRAVVGPNSGIGAPATRCRRSSEQNQGSRFIRQIRILKHVGPERLGCPQMAPTKSSSSSASASGSVWETVFGVCAAPS